MPNTQPVRVGMIGAGFISEYHINGLRAAGAEVAVLYSRREGQARSQAQRFGIPDYTTDYRTILARDDIETVVIATPDFTHRDIAVAAAEAGKAILLQKPMARNSRECLEILEAVERTGTPLYISFMHRYFVEVQHTRELLAEGVLGPVYAVRQRNATPGAGWAAWFYQKESVGGGAMLQLGVHGVDLIRYLFGEIEAVKAVTALMKTERTLVDGSVIYPDNEDLIFAIYRLASGALVTHETAYNEVAGTDRFRMEIYGEKGTVWLRSERGRLALYAPDHLGHAGWLVPTLPEEPLGARHHRHFLAMVRGEEPPDNSAQDGLATVVVAEAVYRSAETGNWEEVRWP